MILIAFRHSATRRLFARVVCWLRGGDSAHVESAIPAPDGRLALSVSASFMDRGVRGKILDFTDARKWRVYRWDAPHVDLMAWLQDHYAAPYDVRGLLGIMAPAVGHDRRARFSSEAVAEHIGLEDPHTYDLVRLEMRLRIRGATPIGWVDGAWRDATGDDSTTGAKCPRAGCIGTMRQGVYMAHTLKGAVDFPGDASPVTLSPGGPGRIATCQKCTHCGHSVAA